MQQLGIGREGDGLGLYGGVHRDPLEVTRARADLLRHTQARGQQQLLTCCQGVSSSGSGHFARARTRAGKSPRRCSVGNTDRRPSAAHGFAEQTVDVFEQTEPDDEPGLDPGPALAIER
jgi:hypothetical protein